jgi:hypothetical protein
MCVRGPGETLGFRSLILTELSKRSEMVDWLCRGFSANMMFYGQVSGVLLLSNSANCSQLTMLIQYLQRPGLEDERGDATERK